MATEAIDPSGNAVIDCSGTKFLVSTIALSLASPLFKAMFLSSFAEGVAVAGSGSSGHSNTPTIELPGDDPAAFKVFDNIAHHRLDSVPAVLEPEALRSLSVFIDKYNCRQALADRGLIWLRRIEERKDLSAKDCWLGILFTYAMDYPTSFAGFTAKLMRLGPQAVAEAEPGEEAKFRSWPHGLDNLEFLPDIIRDYLDDRHDSASRKTHAVMMEVIDMTEDVRGAVTETYIYADPETTKKTNKLSRCDRLDLFVGGYIHCLAKLGILPGLSTAAEHRKSVSELIEIIEAGSIVSGNDRYTASCTGGYACKCPRLKKWNVKKHLLERLRECAEHEGGLCLTCVRYEKCEKHPGGVRGGVSKARAALNNTEEVPNSHACISPHLALGSACK
ncbi:hypothetical protein BDV19DRAFT_386357 [Aspergillus venezuelensis]